MQIEPEAHKERSIPLVVHLNESWELNHWCEELNLRAEELREIVKKVGPDINDIREYLAKRNIGREETF